MKFWVFFWGQKKNDFSANEILQTRISGILVRISSKIHLKTFLKTLLICKIKIES